MQFQAEDLINYQGGVDNIPHVDVYGLEGELAALLPAGFRIDGNFAWEKGKITSHFLALDNVSGVQANNCLSRGLRLRLLRRSVHRVPGIECAAGGGIP